jgi:hypothetical protein
MLIAIIYIIITALKVLVLVEVKLYINDKLSKAITRTLNFNNIINLKALIL